MTGAGILAVLDALAVLALTAAVVILAKRLGRFEDRLDQTAVEVHGLHFRKPTTEKK